MNPSRVTNADIDTDYSEQDRAKVKYFLLHDHMNLPQIQTAEIITFNTIALKGSIRDVGRALDIPLSDVDDICKMVDSDEDKARQQYPELFEYVDIVNGTVVSIGTHPSGVLVSDLNLYEEIGLCTLSSSQYPVSVLNMKELDELFYVKLDILGLDNIGIINDTCKLLGIERLTPDNTNLEDEVVWKSIRDDTTMIFQWESASAQAYLKKFMSNSTLEIAKEWNPNFSYIKWFSFGNGLIRPGCASFRDDVATGHVLMTGFKQLDEFLAPTFGRITMQEDIMKFLVKFCGYSDAESDNVRRGIAKKKGTEQFIEEIHSRFVSYSNKEYGISTDKLEEIFPPIKQGILDASSYAFSWNHSDSYSAIGYICGYLRYYHPVEFITAALNTFKDKEAKTVAITAYAKKVDIPIRPIKFRHSQANYSCDGGVIYKGISSIKHMNDSVADDLYALRNNKYEFFTDLLADIKKTRVNSAQLEILIKLDFFEEFGEIADLLSQVEIFDSLFGRSQIKKEKAEKLGIPVCLLIKCSTKETEKQFSGVNSENLIKSLIVKREEIPQTTLFDKIKYQQEFYGYISIVMPDMDDDVYYITSIDGKFANKNIALYRLCDGSQESYKVKGKKLEGRPIKAGNMIRVLEVTRDKKWRKIDEQWTQIDEYEDILTKYAVIKKEGE